MEWLLPSLLIGSSFFSAKSAKDTNKQQMDLSQQQMEFQREMSNTAHTREVADLRNAGLNPILSANHGASSPSGSMAVLSNPYDTLANDAVNSAKQYAEQSLNKELIKSQQANQTMTYAQANLANANAAKIVAEMPKSSVLGKIGGYLSRGLDSAVGSIESASRNAGTAYANLQNRVSGDVNSALTLKRKYIRG